MITYFGKKPSIKMMLGEFICWFADEIWQIGYRIKSRSVEYTKEEFDANS